MHISKSCQRHPFVMCVGAKDTCASVLKPKVPSRKSFTGAHRRKSEQNCQFYSYHIINEREPIKWVCNFLCVI